MHLKYIRPYCQSRMALSAKRSEDNGIHFEAWRPKGTPADGSNPWRPSGALSKPRCCAGLAVGPDDVVGAWRSNPDAWFLCAGSPDGAARGERRRIADICGSRPWR
jgi:hypothetical protein